jgi:hypothetical protein
MLTDPVFVSEIFTSRTDNDWRTSRQKRAGMVARIVAGWFRILT